MELLFTQTFKQLGIEVGFFDPDKPESIHGLVDENTRLVYMCRACDAEILDAIYLDTKNEKQVPAAEDPNLNADLAILLISKTSS